MHLGSSRELGDEAKGDLTSCGLRHFALSIVAVGVSVIVGYEAKRRRGSWR
jgi:hypothetical protein